MSAELRQSESGELSLSLSLFLAMIGESQTMISYRDNWTPECLHCYVVQLMQPPVGGVLRKPHESPRLLILKAQSERNLRSLHLCV